uniref:Protein Wnt n=1 Tax=Strigamia maritima TaxID=126957 RepID=T1IT71_STRMM
MHIVTTYIRSEDLRWRLVRVSWVYLGMVGISTPEEPKLEKNALNSLCTTVPGLVTQQLHVCESNPHIISAVSEGARRGIYECQYQFRHERWNCTTIDEENVFGYTITRVCPLLIEKYYMEALLSRLCHALIEKKSPFYSISGVMHCPVAVCMAIIRYFEMEYQNSEMEYKNSEMEYKNSEMEYKNSEMEYKNSEMEYKNSEMEYKNSEMEYKNSEMEYKNSEMEYKNSEMEYKNSEMEYKNSEMEYKNSEMEYKNSEIEQKFQI